MSIGMQCPQGHQLGPDDTVCPTCGTLAVTQGERMPLPSASIYPTIPGYRIVEELGRGGMGVVYRAEHLELKRQVALKMILAGALAGPRDLTRFRDEAEAMARFHHPRILQIYHVGEIDGNPFLTLELAEGGTLARKSGGKPQPPHEAAALVESLAQAVHAAHEHGIIHRDLKPANILLDAKGAPKISDFGLAKQMDQADDRTATGAILGTPSYMAPEQARGKSKSQAIGPAADVYALGAILYDLLTGRPPFLGESPVDTLQQVLGQEPVPPTRLQPKVSPELEGICLHCLEKQPSLRYPSAQALADDLRRFQNHEPTLVRPVSPWGRLRKWARRRPAAAALIGVILAALTALFLMGFFYNLELQNALANIGLEKQATTAARLEIDKEKTATNLARQEVEQQKNATASARKDVDQQKEATAAAQEEADYNLYLSQIILADSQFHANRVAFAEQALGKCPPRLRGWEWRYLKLLCHAEVMTLLGPTASVTALAFSNDHQRLAVASWDGAIYVFNPQSGAMVHYLRGHIGPVNAVAYHPEGTVLAAAASRSTISTPIP